MTSPTRPKPFIWTVTHRKAAVVVVPDLPRTRSGKIMRRVARAAWLGLDPGDQSALENPPAVTAIAAAAGRDATVP